MSKRLPIVSIGVISNKNKCPPNYIPILKTFDDNSDADVYKDFALWAKTCRYIAISRHFDDPAKLEVITDIMIFNERKAIPAQFISLDFTIDSNEKALRKKFLCVRSTPRNDALDAVTDLIVLNKSKHLPKGYTYAGEVDGFIICFKVESIPDNYAPFSRSQLGSENSYPPLPHRSFTAGLHCHSVTDLKVFKVVEEFKYFTAQQEEIRGIDGVPFKLRNDLERSSNDKDFDDLPKLVDPSTSINFDYNFTIEKRLLTKSSQCSM